MKKFLLLVMLGALPFSGAMAKIFVKAEHPVAAEGSNGVPEGLDIELSVDSSRVVSFVPEGGSEDQHLFGTFIPVDLKGKNTIEVNCGQHIAGDDKKQVIDGQYYIIKTTYNSKLYPARTRPSHRRGCSFEIDEAKQ